MYGYCCKRRRMVNLTNHPFSAWEEKQVQAAKKYGEIKEIPFPIVSPYADSKELDTLAEEYKDKILALGDQYVLLQGEFTFTYRLVQLLKAEKIHVFAACSERDVRERMKKDGKIVKESRFDFVQFREY